MGEPTEEQRRKWREKASRQYHSDPEAKLARLHSRGIPCRECGTPRAVDPKHREKVLAQGGPLCHACRRKEADRLAALEAEIRERRLTSRPANPVVRRSNKGSGRSGTGNRRYRTNRILVLTASDICGICGHPGACTVDHIVSARDWPAGVPGMDDVDNLQPAHGTMGSGGAVNRCPTCGQLCNQARGSRAIRRWQADRAAARAKTMGA